MQEAIREKSAVFYTVRVRMCKKSAQNAVSSLKVSFLEFLINTRNAVLGHSEHGCETGKLSSDKWEK